MARKPGPIARLSRRGSPAGSQDPDAGDQDDGDARSVAEHVKIVSGELGPVSVSLATWVTLADLHDMILHLCDGDAARVDELLGPLDDVGRSMVMYNEGFEAYRDGEMGKAAASFARAIEILPWNVLARFTLASVRFLEGDVEGALVTYLDILPMVQSMARSEVLTNAGMCAYKLGRLPEARDNFQEALALDPANALAWHDLAALDDVEGNVEPARAGYLKALTINPRDPETWYNLGTLLGKQGLKAERLHCFIQAEAHGFAELRDLIEDLLDQGIEPRCPAGL